MRKNKEMRKTMKERIKAPMGKMILYSLLFFILVEALSLVLGQAPIIGDLASAIIVGAATIGFMASMINIYVGNEDEKPFSYFSHMAKHFKLWIFSRLWLILKYLPGMIVMTAGVVIMAAGGLGAILQYASVEELLDPDVLASVGIVALLGVLLFLITFES